jgi:hypothetical protein
VNKRKENEKIKETKKTEETEKMKYQDYLVKRIIWGAFKVIGVLFAISGIVGSSLFVLLLGVFLFGIGWYKKNEMSWKREQEADRNYIYKGKFSR